MKNLFLNILFLIIFNTIFCNTDFENLKQYQLEIIKAECIRNPKYSYSDAEVKNLIEALDFIKTSNLVNKSRKDITLQTILDIHKIILKDINNENAGKLRSVIVSIDNNSYKFPEPYEVESQLNDFIKWLHETEDNEIIVAIDAHLKFVNIHPFYDGNGRTARLIMNILLIQAGYAPIILDIEKRDDYFAAIKKAQVDKDLTDYYDFFINI